jgi:hypothetical protein
MTHITTSKERKFMVKFYSVDKQRKYSRLQPRSGMHGDSVLSNQAREPARMRDEMFGAIFKRSGTAAAAPDLATSQVAIDQAAARFAPIPQATLDQFAQAAAMQTPMTPKADNKAAKIAIPTAIGAGLGLLAGPLGALAGGAAGAAIGKYIASK